MGHGRCPWFAVAVRPALANARRAAIGIKPDHRHARCSPGNTPDDFFAGLTLAPPTLRRRGFGDLTENRDLAKHGLAVATYGALLLQRAEGEIHLWPAGADEGGDFALRNAEGEPRLGPRRSGRM